MFITAFTRARQLSLSWASSIQSIPPHPTSWRSILPNLMSLFSLLSSNQSISPGPRQLFMFRCKSSFYGEDLPTPRPTTKLEDHHLSAVRDCLFNIFAATFHIGGRSSIRNLRDAPCPGDRDPLITDHQFNIQQIYAYVFCVDLRTNSDYFTVQH